MIYTRENKNRKTFGYFLIGILLLVFILIQYFFPRFLSSVFTSMATPFWRVEFAIESGLLSSFDNLLKENEMLKQKLLDNETRLSIVSFIEEENQTLRDLIGKASTTSGIVVPVLKRPPFAPYDEFVVDGGSDIGISTSSIVFAGAGVPIGRVEDVKQKTSKIILFSSPGEKHEVLVGKDNIPAIAYGKGGGQYEIELPRGISINEGDYVSLVGYDYRPIGKVIDNNDDSVSPFYKITFSTPVNIYQLRWIIISK